MVVIVGLLLLRILRLIGLLWLLTTKWRVILRLLLILLLVLLRHHMLHLHPRAWSTHMYWWISLHPHHRCLISPWWRHPKLSLLLALMHGGS